jgi:hypothetical protein
MIGLGTGTLLQPGALRGEFVLLLRQRGPPAGRMFPAAAAGDLQSLLIPVTPPPARVASASEVGEWAREHSGRMGRREDDPRAFTNLAVLVFVLPLSMI